MSISIKRPLGYLAKAAPVILLLICTGVLCYWGGIQLGEKLGDMMDPQTPGTVAIADGIKLSILEMERKQDDLLEARLEMELKQHVMSPRRTLNGRRLGGRV